ncbi:hypothetical protein DERP_012818 [Dermatophagoides pteronyssinus]|uniref:Uncharacterized protein n=1 Tax=Dermatophagoides pteronyssinus TaxID=6956 RepID=A0ABQ8JFQ9_DERPT|nr:hypothetical protein DERP_012818 [Dermatophagoides pteronyssinus]
MQGPTITTTTTTTPYLRYPYLRNEMTFVIQSSSAQLAIGYGHFNFNIIAADVDRNHVFL